MNAAKKIVAFRGDRGACWAERIHFPFKHLAEKHGDNYHITVTGVLDTRQLKGFDLCLFQRQYRKDVHLPMLEMRRFGAKIVYEIDDDLFNIERHNPAYNILGKRSVQDNIKHFLSQVDACFVTNQYLADLYGKYCEHIYILPNSIEFELVYPPPNNSTKKVILWQGSQTHDRDVSLIKPALQKLAKNKDLQIKLWRIDLGIPDTYIVPYVPFESFHAMFSQMDAYIGLAPITFTPFNKGKSNLKFIEYAAQGIAAITSDFGDYKTTIETPEEDIGLLINDNRDWYDAIMYLVENEDVHARMVDNAREFVKEKFNIAKNYMYWKDAIDDVLARDSKRVDTRKYF